MKLFLHEISDLETELSFTQDDQWVREAVCRVDEHQEDSKQSSVKPNAKVRPIEAYLSLRNVDEVIVVSGQINTYVELVCSRCATAFQHVCKPNFSALFCNDPATAGVAHLHKQNINSREPGRPMGQNQGFARHAHNAEDDDLVAEGKDLDITYLSQDFIDLSDVLTEQLQLQVPFQPLCKESCKGICAECGTDFNHGRCACAKIKTTTPFSVLSDFKL